MLISKSAKFLPIFAQKARIFTNFCLVFPQKARFFHPFFLPILPRLSKPTPQTPLLAQKPTTHCKKLKKAQVSSNLENLNF